jgi:hypothetical protein
VPTYVVLGAKSISVETSDHTPLATIPLTVDVATAATGLSTAIGEQPVVTPYAAVGDCKAGSTYQWGGLQLSNANPFQPQEDLIGAWVNAGKTAGGIEIVTSGYQQLGAKLSDVLVQVPGAKQADNGVLVDLQTDPKLGAWGVLLVKNSSGTADAIEDPSFGGAHGGCAG